MVLAIWFFIFSTFVLPTCADEVIVNGKSKRWILGGIGQSCNSVCMKYNSICSPDVSGSKYGWPISSTDLANIMESTEMNGTFRCTKYYCDDQTFNALSPSTDGTKCIYSTEGNVSTCAAYHNLMQRFCPCDGDITNPDYSVIYESVYRNRCLSSLCNCFTLFCI